jgi:hypothetical protein
MERLALRQRAAHFLTEPDAQDVFCFLCFDGDVCGPAEAVCLSH